MSDVVLSAGVRQNLLALQSTADLMSLTQNRLATGKKVNSALDNPGNFFTSQSLNNRASDLNALLDSIGQAQKTIEAADQGITSLTKLVESAKSVAKQALQAPQPSSATYSSVALTGNPTDESLGATTAALLHGRERHDLFVQIDAQGHRRHHRQLHRRRAPRRCRNPCRLAGGLLDRAGNPRHRPASATLTATAAVPVSRSTPSTPTSTSRSRSRVSLASPTAPTPRPACSKTSAQAHRQHAHIRCERRRQPGRDLRYRSRAKCRPWPSCRRGSTRSAASRPRINGAINITLNSSSSQNSLTITSSILGLTTNLGLALGGR